MEKVRHWRQRAAEIRQIAKSINDKRAAAVLGDMAQELEDLADERERELAQPR